MRKIIMNATLEQMQARLVDAVLKSDSIQNVVELTQRFAETAGIVAGTMIARRVKDCCGTCASPEGVAVTINDMINTFKVSLEESARATASAINTDEVAVFKGIQLHNNPPKEEVKPGRAYIDFVIDSTNHFVDVHDPEGKSFAAGAWVTLDGGLSALRVFPHVFGPQPKPEPNKDPEDPIAAAIVKQLRAVGFDVGDLKVVHASSPIEAILKMAGVPVSDETVSKLNAASAHHRTCRCESCLLWWAYSGPDQVPGDYGPFTKVEVNAKQKELKIEETP